MISDEFEKKNLILRSVHILLLVVDDHGAKLLPIMIDVSCLLQSVDQVSRILFSAIVQNHKELARSGDG